MTGDELLGVIVSSGLLSDDDARSLKESLGSGGQPAASAQQLAERLVNSGKLTQFQAQQALAGKAQALVMGDYVIVDRVGAGGMGQVFRARHRRMKRVVALKLMSAIALQHAENIKRFQREVEAAAKLTHPNIVVAYDAGEAHGRHYLVMEYVAGRDLAATVHERGPLPVDEAVDYIRQAALGLAYAHGKGIVHRDIKPGNLLLDSDGVVKILDMGLARLEDSQAVPQDGLTGSGQMLGTVDYMAPEQAFDTHAADARADIYSLGCSLYRLLVGENMYRGDTVVAKYVAHREAPIPDLRAKRPDVPPALDAVFHRMVAKLPADRYQTMSEVVAALEQCQVAPSASGASTNHGSEPTTAWSTAEGDLASALPDSKTGHTIEDTLSNSHPEARTDIRQRLRPAVSGAGRKNRGIYIAAAAAGFAFVLLGIWLIVRDREGKEVVRIEAGDGTKVQVPAGGSVEVKVDGAASANAKRPLDAAPVGAPGARQQTQSPPAAGSVDSAAQPRAIGSKAVGVGSGPESGSLVTNAVVPKTQQRSVAPPLEGGDADREVAKWAIGIGGTVWTGGVDTIKKFDDLPQSPFAIKSLVFFRKESQITAADVDRWSRLTELQGIEIKSGASIPADAIRSFARCRRLTGFSAGANAVDADALLALTGLKRLRSIRLSKIEVPDRFFAELARLPRLDSVFLGNCKFTAAGIEQFAVSPPKKLATVDLEWTNITPHGIRRLAQLPHLSDLDLSGTGITDSLLAAFDHGTALSKIELFGTKVTSVGTTQLFKSLHGCSIYVSDVEQAPATLNETYRITLNNLLRRGFTIRFARTDRGFSVEYKDSDALPPLPFNIQRIAVPTTTTLEDWREVAMLPDVTWVKADMSGATVVPPGAIDALRPLENLTSLGLPRARLLTKDEIAMLPSFKKLRFLDITLENDSDMTTIAALPHLSSLRVSGERLTDACLKPLEAAMVLNELEIRGGVPISRDAALAFAKARPDVMVTWRDENLDLVLEPGEANQ